MVEHAQRQLGRVGNVKLRDVAVRLNQAKQGEDAVECSCFAVRDDCGDPPPAHQAGVD